MKTTLFPLPPATGRLTPRQQLAYDLLHAEPIGLTASSVGYSLHLRKDCPYCLPLSGPCPYVADTGKEVLGALRKRGLVIRRRSGLWQLIGLVKSTPTDPSSDPFPLGF